jgi:hypothetical protein
MSHHRLRLRICLACVLGAAAPWLTDVIAQNASEVVSKTNKVAGLTLGLVSGEVVGQEQVIRGLIRIGPDHEFVFVVPDGLRAQTLPGGSVVMVSRDMRYSVSIRFLEPSPASSRLREPLREWIASQYTQVSHLEEIAATVAQHEGVGFQFRQELPQVGGRILSILWVPFKAGVIEFALNADEKSASTGRGPFDMVLLTFRSNELGRLEIIKRSDKS